MRRTVTEMVLTSGPWTTFAALLLARSISIRTPMKLSEALGWVRAGMVR